MPVTGQDQNIFRQVGRSMFFESLKFDEVSLYYSAIEILLIKVGCPSSIILWYGDHRRFTMQGTRICEFANEIFIG